MRFLAPVVVSVTLVLATVGVRLYAGVEANDNGANDDQAVSALIVFQETLDKNGVGRTKAIRVDDREKVAALEAFFPNYRRQPQNDKAGGWEDGYNVYFDFDKGKSLRVTVYLNENAGFWAMGSGGFETNGDFNAFVARLQRP